jgi:hypothetical protein
MWSATSTVPMEIVLGGDVPMIPEACYARLSGQDGLVMVSKGLRMLATSEMMVLRDRRVLLSERDQITGVTLETPEQELRLEWSDNVWRMRKPLDRAASQVQIQRVIQTWLDARVEIFLPAEPEREVLYRASFDQKGNGAPSRATYEVLGGDVPAGRAWLRREKDGEILQVVPDLVRFSPVDSLPYLSRQILNFNPSLVVRLSITQGDQSSVVSRLMGSESWSSREENQQVHTLTVENVLAGLSTLYAGKLVALNPDSLAEYGLDRPTIRLSIGLGGEKPANYTVLIHVSETDDLSYALLQGQNLVFGFPHSQLEVIRQPIISEVTPPAQTSNGPPEENE